LVTLLSATSVHAYEKIVYYHNDLAGSPIAATDQSGNVVWKESYTPYGQRLRNQDNTNKIWFHGKPADVETGLSYFGARHYDPVIGRFMGPDPAGFTEGNVHSFNRYSYASNNPYRFQDPDGNTPIDAIFLAYDLGNLAYAIGNGEGIGDASIGVGLGLLGVVSPIPGVVQALRVAKAAERGIEVARATSAVAKGASNADAAIAETLASKGNLTSATQLSSDELLQAGEKFLGPGYKEIGKPGSGVFRSSDGTRQFRIDNSSLSGSHAPGVPHGHLETYAPGAAKPTTNNHIPFFD